MNSYLQHGYRIGDRIILPLEGTISGPDGVLHMEPKAIDVLNQLVLHENQVVSQLDLIERVWHRRCVTTSCLYKVVSHLRAALASGSEGHRVLKTVPKRGYLLVGPVHQIDVPTGESDSDRTSGDTAVRPPVPLAPNEILARPTLGRVSTGYALLASAALCIAKPLFATFDAPALFLPLLVLLAVLGFPLVVAGAIVLNYRLK